MFLINHHQVCRKFADVRLFVCVVLSLITLHMAMLPSNIAAEEEIRIVLGIGSADQLIADTEHLVVELAGRAESYENNIFPNIDIFLIGVDPTKPVRFDPIFGAEHGMELQPLIPFLDLKEFLDENLDPIGIIPKRDRRDRELYELTGNVYEGWLRVLADPEYVVIFPRKEAILKGMAHPASLHEELVEKGYLLFGHLDNTQTSAETRKAAFELMRKNTVDGIQKKPDETQAAHTLRKAVLDHQLSILQQWFVEGQSVKLGNKLDQENNVSLSDILFSAFSGTQLEKDILRVREEPSYFSALTEAEAALLTIRVNFTFNEATAAGYQDIYKLSDIVLQEQIEESQGGSDEERQARLKVSQLVNKILTQSTELGVVDSFLDIAPVGESHVLVLGIRAKGQAEIQETIEELPKARAGWQLEKNVAEVNGIQIHRLSLGETTPASLKKLYGDGAAVAHLAVGEESFWMAFGENSLEELSARIQKVISTTERVGNNKLLAVTAQLGPISQSISDLLNDEGSVLGNLLQERMQQQRPEIQQAESQGDEKAKPSEESRSARSAASTLLSLEGLDKVAAAMKGENDHLQFSLEVNEEGVIVGKGAAHKGILKALGTLMANFADENLQ